MSLEASLKAAWGSAHAQAKAVAAFDAWWSAEMNRMRNAKMAAPRGTDSQGPPFLPRQFRAPLARSLAERAMHAKVAAQVRYLTRKAARQQEHHA